MVRPAKSRPSTASNPEITERSRLKRLAFSKRILSESAAKPQAPLSPSKTVLKHHGKDIIKKSHRKNRFLFSFPGLLAPITGGKIGELKDLGTKNPILYLDFPQGQMKLFGTIVYPKNRYLTLQFSRGGKNVMCEDYFDNMIVFSDAWWIGRKEDNPQEARLEFPKEMIEGPHVEHDFKRGAGGGSMDKPVINRTGKKRKDKDSPETEIEEEASEDDDKLKEPMELTPVRHSERNAGKKLRYIESSPEENSDGSDVPTTAEEKKLAINPDFSAEKSTQRMDGSSTFSVEDIDIGDAMKKTEQSRRLLISSTKDKSGEASRNNHGSLKQATISTLFKKAGEKKAPKDQKMSPPRKDSGRKSKQSASKRKIEQLDDDDDDIDEISSSSEANDGSGEEWTG